MNLEPTCFFFCSAKTSIHPFLLLPALYFLLGKSLCQEHIVNESLIAAALKESALCKAHV